MAPVVEAYRAMRGVSFLVAATFAAEIGDVACGAGFLVTNIVDIHPRVIAVLAAVGARAR